MFGETSLVKKKFLKLVNQLCAQFNSVFLTQMDGKSVVVAS